MNFSCLDSLNQSSNPSLHYAMRVLSMYEDNGSVEFLKEDPKLLGADIVKKITVPQSRIFRTSGSSGVPQKVYHNEETITFAVEALLDRIGRENYSSFCCLPLNHVGGWMQVERAFRTGGSVLFGDYKDLTEVDMVEILKQRWISLVPTQLHVLLNSSLALKNLRSSLGIFVGGAELPPAIEMKAREAGIPLWPCYGMTETAGMITALDSDSFLDHGSGVGTCLSHSRIKIVEGRLSIKSKSLCYRFGESKIPKDDWYETPDLGAFEDDTGYRITGRTDRSIITGGEMVSPQVVENCLRETSLVTDCMVVGEEDNHWGQRVTAFIILKSNAQIDDLKKIAKKSLSSIEYPKDWKVVDAIPISEMGKLKE